MFRRRDSRPMAPRGGPETGRARWAVQGMRIRRDGPVLVVADTTWPIQLLLVVLGAAALAWALSGGAPVGLGDWIVTALVAAAGLLITVTGLVGYRSIVTIDTLDRSITFDRRGLGGGRRRLDLAEVAGVELVETETESGTGWNVAVALTSGELRRLSRGGFLTREGAEGVAEAVRAALRG